MQGGEDTRLTLAKARDVAGKLVPPPNGDHAPKHVSGGCRFQALTSSPPVLLSPRANGRRPDEFDPLRRVPIVRARAR